MSEQSKRRSFLVVPADQSIGGVAWQPAADIYRTSTGWLLKFELAGVTSDDVAVEVHGSRLTVRGVRRDLLIGECCKHYSMEIAYDRFERMVELPCDLQQAHLKLEFRDGILVVRITCKRERS